MEREEDEALMLATGRGDRAAFSVLVRRHLGRASAIAGRMLGNAAEAEEVVQEAPEMPDPAPGAEESLVAAERRRHVEAALARLPDRQRAAVILSYYEGLSNAEVAGALDVSVGAVESLLVRARRGLAQMLGHLTALEEA
jgi:RNA polymerase sigma-70 factor (ECF subfamily)